MDLDGLTYVKHCTNQPGLSLYLYFLNLFPCKPTLFYTSIIPVIYPSFPNSLLSETVFSIPSPLKLSHHPNSSYNHIDTIVYEITLHKFTFIDIVWSQDILIWTEMYAVLYFCIVS